MMGREGRERSFYAQPLKVPWPCWAAWTKLIKQQRKTTPCFPFITKWKERRGDFPCFSRHYERNCLFSDLSTLKCTMTVLYWNFITAPSKIICIYPFYAFIDHCLGVGICFYNLTHLFYERFWSDFLKFNFIILYLGANFLIYLASP